MAAWRPGLAHDSQPSLATVLGPPLTGSDNRRTRFTTPKCPLPRQPGAAGRHHPVYLSTTPGKPVDTPVDGSSALAKQARKAAITCELVFDRGAFYVDGAGHSPDSASAARKPSRAGSWETIRSGSPTTESVRKNQPIEFLAGLGRRYR